MALPLPNIGRRATWIFIAALALSGAAALSYWSFAMSAAILGGNRAWAGEIRLLLIDWGVPAQFLLDVSIALLHVPQWAVVAVITFSLGMTRLRKAHEFAWVFSGAVPTADIVIAVIRSGPYGIFDVPLLMSLRLYVLIPMLGAMVGVAAWWAGYSLRGRHGRGADCCTVCGYNLSGARSAICPECGHTTTTRAI